MIEIPNWPLLPSSGLELEVELLSALIFFAMGLEMLKSFITSLDKPKISATGDLTICSTRSKMNYLVTTYRPLGGRVIDAKVNSKTASVKVKIGERREHRDTATYAGINDARTK